MGSSIAVCYRDVLSRARAPLSWVWEFFIPDSPDVISRSGPATAPGSGMSPGHPAAFQGPRLLPPGQQQMGLPPAPQLPPPPANSANGLSAQPALPPVARQGGVPGPVPPNPNLQHLPGQPPGPGYHPQQGREGCLLCAWKQRCRSNHWWNCARS